MRYCDSYKFYVHLYSLLHLIGYCTAPGCLMEKTATKCQSFVDLPAAGGNSIVLTHILQNNKRSLANLIRFNN